ncbi:hypothetical protein [Synechococcus sp. UW140]|uniref:hypothetical protein n=1 Tax=Synechococcus sp. UW140 TaxID=368503 RepID=UPI0025FD9AD1|nr:hypothetical protein [Synechococcus sp. UW140]
MASFQSDFQAALPFPIKWAVNENKFDSDGKNPLSLSVFVPAESAFALAQFLLDTAEDPAKTKTAKVWDYSKNEEVEVQGFYINGKGKPGRDGDRTSYGSINPAKPANSSSNLKAEDIF